MNAHMQDRDGFTVVEKSTYPPPQAETMVIPDSNPPANPTVTEEKSRPDLVPVPDGPADHTLKPTESRKAPVLP